MLITFIKIYLSAVLGFYIPYFFVKIENQNAWEIIEKFTRITGSLVVGIYICVPAFLLNQFLLKDHIAEELLLLFVFLLAIVMCYIHVRPSPPFNYEKEEEKREKELVLLFNKYSPYYPSIETKTKDVALINEEISTLLRGFDFGDNAKSSEKVKISDRDKNRYEKINRFLGVGGNTPLNQIKKGSGLYTTLLKASRTLEFHFITYSPNGQYFVCYFSFKSYASHLKKDVDSSEIIFGEKIENSIYLYQYSGLFKTYCEMDEHRYKFFTGWDKSECIIGNLDKYSLTRIFEYPRCNPMDPLFWEDPNFFSEVKVGEHRYTRFKTYNQLHNLAKSPYKLREKLVIS